MATVNYLYDVDDDDDVDADNNKNSSSSSSRSSSSSSSSRSTIYKSVFTNVLLQPGWSVYVWNMFMCTN